MRIHGHPNTTLGAISVALSRGAVSQIGRGFHDRNSLVSDRADAIFACTFGNKTELKDGGTADTWRKFREAKPGAPAYHLDLTNCTLWLVPPVQRLAQEAELLPPSPCLRT